MSIDITVKDRKDKDIASFPNLSQDLTVQQFKVLFLKECEIARKQKLYPARLRFTLGETRGTALSDSRKAMSHYIS